MNKIKYSVVALPWQPCMLAIYIRCQQFNHFVDIDTSVHIFNEEWDSNIEMVVGNPNARKLNLLIRKTVYQLEEYELDYDGDFTLMKLEQIWNGRTSGHDFYALMDNQINQRDIRPSTKDIHKRVLNHLRRYRGECLVSDLTEDFAKGFIRYMKGINLNPNTISMHIKVLRCYYHIAKKMFGSKVPSDSFLFFHDTAEQRYNYKMQPLSDDDIRLLENYVSIPTTPLNYVKTLEQFLFMSYTGVRISDFVSLSEKNLTFENGKMWLTYDSVKTDTHVRLPISYIFDGRAEQIINKHIFDLDGFFHFKKANFNARLKVACRHAGITKRVSAHTARHTCATRLVNKDVPVTTIQKVIGHRTLKMTMIYAKTNESTLVRQLA